MTTTMWNEEQADFISRPTGHGTLIGTPGGGKTRSIIGRVHAMIADGRVPAGRAGFVILTFSRLACQDFRRKGNQLCPGHVFNQGNVRTLHSLAGLIVARLRKDAEQAVTVSSMQTVVSRASGMVRALSREDLRSRVPLLRDVSAVFVDEAQDISQVQYAFVMDLSDSLGASVVMVGDPNQSIYGFQGGDCKFLLDHPGWKVSLRKNYRSTPRLVNVVNAARPCASSVAMESAADYPAEHDVRPTLFCGDEEELRQHLVSSIEREKSRDGLKSCAIIGPTKRCFSSTSGKMINIGLQWVANVLSKEGLPFEIHYDETKEGSERSAAMEYFTTATFRPGRVHLMTIHGSKGLEFDSVILMNFHLRTYGRQPSSAENLQTFRYMWYVAMSRARLRMTCMCWNQRAPWNSFDDGFVALFRRDGRPLHREKLPLTYSDPPVVLRWKWTDLLNDRKILDETRLCVLEDNMLGACVGGCGDAASSFADPCTDLPDWSHVSSAYGSWAENYFEYCYRRGVPDCLRRIDIMSENSVQVSEKGHVATVRLIREQRSMSNTEPFTMAILVEHLAKTRQRDDVVSRERADGILLLMNWLESNGGPLVKTQFHVHVPNVCQWLDVDALKRMKNDWMRRLDQLTAADVWRMAFLLWQYECEAKYRWEEDLPRTEDVAAALEPHAFHIENWASSLSDGWVFQVNCEWNGLPIRGTADAVNRAEKMIVEFKFSPGGFQTMHALQVVGYAEMITNFEGDGWKTQVWNLYNGDVRDVKAKWGADDRDRVTQALEQTLLSR